MLLFWLAYHAWPSWSSKPGRFAFQNIQVREIKLKKLTGLDKKCLYLFFTLKLSFYWSPPSQIIGSLSRWWVHLWSREEISMLTYEWPHHLPLLFSSVSFGKQTMKNAPKINSMVPSPYTGFVCLKEVMPLYQWDLNFYAVVGKQKVKNDSVAHKISSAVFSEMYFCMRSFLTYLGVQWPVPAGQRYLTVGLSLTARVGHFRGTRMFFLEPYARTTLEERVSARADANLPLWYCIKRIFACSFVIALHRCLFPEYWLKFLEGIFHANEAKLHLTGSETYIAVSGIWHLREVKQI